MRLIQKWDQRRAIASVMIQVCEEKGEIQRAQFWREVLESVEILTVDGMSDEEDGTEGDESVRLVKVLDYRHPDFRKLFKKVDDVRMKDSSIFRNTGRKRLRRVYVSEITSRPPPTNIPSSYCCQEYLDYIGQQSAPNVKLHENSGFTIPRLVCSCFAVQSQLNVIHCRF